MREPSAGQWSGAFLLAVLLHGAVLLAFALHTPPPRDDVAATERTPVNIGSGGSTAPQAAAPAPPAAAEELAPGAVDAVPPDPIAAAPMAPPLAPSADVETPDTTAELPPILSPAEDPAPPAEIRKAESPSESGPESPPKSRPEQPPESRTELPPASGPEPVAEALSPLAPPLADARSAQPPRPLETELATEATPPAAAIARRGDTPTAERPVPQTSAAPAPEPELVRDRSPPGTVAATPPPLAAPRAMAAPKTPGTVEDLATAAFHPPNVSPAEDPATRAAIGVEERSPEMGPGSPAEALPRSAPPARETQPVQPETALEARPFTRDAVPESAAARPADPTSAEQPVPRPSSPPGPAELSPERPPQRTAVEAPLTVVTARPAPASADAADTAETDDSAAELLEAYLARLRTHLDGYKKYPEDMRRRGEEGTALVRLAIDRSGRILDYRIEKSSGYDSLDREARDMIRRAQPFPAMPDGIGRSHLAVHVPVHFRLR